jgi:EpsI family protein
MNCLPGAGWIPAQVDRVRIADPRSPGRSVSVNRVIVQKGEQRQMALYWYQSRGNVVASEYASKMHLFFGALRTGRTDAALVRIMRPIEEGAGSDPDDDIAQFASALLPLLGRHVPD